MYAPAMDNASTKQLEALPAAIHEFRIPPKALTGLHSYCPVHFDTLHAVLVDVSVHISVLKSAAYRRPPSLSRFVKKDFFFCILHNLISGKCSVPTSNNFLRVFSYLNFVIVMISS